MLAATEDGSNISIGGVVVGGSVGACVVVGWVVVVASVVVVSAVVVKFAVVVVDPTVVDAFTDANVVMKIITQKIVFLQETFFLLPPWCKQNHAHGGFVQIKKGKYKFWFTCNKIQTIFFFISLVILL